jgi:hypothetical protein
VVSRNGRSLQHGFGHPLATGSPSV